MEGYADIVLNHRFYFGYCSTEEIEAAKLKALCKLSQLVPGTSGKDTELFWR
jgi:hypothetical protein